MRNSTWLVGALSLAFCLAVVPAAQGEVAVGDDAPAFELKGSDGKTQSHTIGNLVVLNEAKREYVVPLTEPLPANPVIEVHLDNIFAPQMEGETETLAPYKVKTEIRKAELDTEADADFEIKEAEVTAQ